MQRLNKSVNSRYKYLKRIKFLKKIFIVLLLVFAIISLSIMIFNELKEKIKTNHSQQHILSSSKYNISNLKFIKDFDILKKYKIFSPKYTELKDKSIIKEPLLHVLDNNILYAVLNAERGVLFEELQKLNLSNKIDLRYFEYLQLLSEEAVLNLKTMVITSDQFAKINWHKSFFNSPKGFLVNLKDKKAIFFGTIKGKYYNIQNQEILFEGETLEIEDKANFVSLEKNVLIIIENKKLTTQKLIYNKKKNIVDIIGDTKLTTLDEDVVSNGGYIDLNTKKMHLTNGVILKKQNTIVKGKEFIYDYINNETSVISDYKKVQISINK